MDDLPLAVPALQAKKELGTGINYGGVHKTEMNQGSLCRDTQQVS